MKKKTIPSDPLVDDVRAIRHAISAQFDHDPVRLGAYYMELQKQYEGRFFDPARDRGKPRLPSS